MINNQATITHAGSSKSLADAPVLKSWLWKRIPRTSDSDKKSFRRMAMTRLVKKQTFQKRWFEFNPAENVISYHKEQPLGEEENVHVQGTIAISSIVDILTVSPDNIKQSIHEREETPTPHVFDIHCVGRVYTMCAPSEEQMEEWVASLRTALAEERRKKKRLNGRCQVWLPNPTIAPTTIPTPTYPLTTCCPLPILPDLQQKAGIGMDSITDDKVKALASNQNGSVENQSKAVNRCVGHHRQPKSSFATHHPPPTAHRPPLTAYPPPSTQLPRRREPVDAVDG